MRRSALAKRPRNKVKTKSFVLKGGLNLVDSPLQIPDGMLLTGLNYELLTRDGYRSLAGIERFDGQNKPTDATYWILYYDNGTIAFIEGDIVDGLTSGHSAKVLSVWGDTVSGYLVITEATGIFQDNEPLQVSAVTRALVDGNADLRGAATPAEDSTFIQDAIETQRALIKKVGESDGSGPVRGVHVYSGSTYAFRDNAAVTECLMWKQSGAGWVQQNLGNRVAFTLGTLEFVEGETLTQTGTTSTINRVVKQSGDWGTSDAAGYLIIGTVTAGPYASGLATSPSGSATLSGAEVANTIQPGGHYEFENYNFFGTSGTFRMYGVSGVDYAFEWDGLVFVPIITGNTNDKPTHLAINEYHLQLAFEKGSLQNSATGLPYVWAGGGAAEIGTGDELIGLKKEIGGALIVLCRNRVFALYGKNTAGSQWDLRTISDESGGIEWSPQRMSATRFMDDRGFTQVAAVQEFGDFASSVYSQVIEPLILSKKNDVVASLLVKSKSQIRTFFNDGTGIIATFDGKKVAGFTLFRYQDVNNAGIIASCTANGEDSSGNEILYMGSENGYIYQVDKGTSFDGGEINTSMILSYSHCGSPSQDKQFKKVTIQAEGPAGTQIEYNVLLDYSSGRAPSGITLTELLASGGSLWNQVFWNEFNWASEDITQIEGNIDGVGRNISLQLQSIATYVEPHTLFSVTFHYIPRKIVR